jgi:guanylate kinase
MERGHVFVISGVSGSGKSTVSDYLTDKYHDITRSIAVTTRKPREGEMFASHYFFVDKDRFQWLIDTHQLLEYTIVYNDHYYGTLNLSVEQALERGRHVLFVVDNYGAEQISSKMPNAKVVYLMAPSEDEQRIRLETRGTTGPELDERIAKARMELAHAREMNWTVVVNDVREKTFAEIEQVFGLTQE